MSTTIRTDRRRKPRGLISMPVSLAAGSGSVPVEAETLDLSEGGALLRTHVRLTPGAATTLRFAFEGTSHSARIYQADGRVARAYADNLVAVAFDDVSDDLLSFARTLTGG